MADGRDNRIFWVIGGIALLSVGGLATTIWISESNDVSDGYIPIEEREGWGDDAADAGRAEVSPRRPPPEPEPAPAFDEEALARELVDAGPRSAIPAVKVVRTAPPTPQRSLSRLHVLQGLLETRIDQLTARRDAARAEGDDALVQRMDRQIERLVTQRAPLERRIDELDTEVEEVEAREAEERAPEVASPE